MTAHVRTHLNMDHPQGVDLQELLLRFSLHVGMSGKNMERTGSKYPFRALRQLKMSIFTYSTVIFLTKKVGVAVFQFGEKILCAQLP